MGLAPLPITPAFLSVCSLVLLANVTPLCLEVFGRADHVVVPVKMLGGLVPASPLTPVVTPSPFPASQAVVPLPGHGGPPASPLFAVDTLVEPRRFCKSKVA